MWEVVSHRILSNGKKIVFAFRRHFPSTNHSGDNPWLAPVQLDANNQRPRCGELSRGNARANSSSKGDCSAALCCPS